MEMSAPVHFFLWLQTAIHGMSLLIMPQDTEIVTSFCACSSTVFPGGTFFIDRNTNRSVLSCIVPLC